MNVERVQMYSVDTSIYARQMTGWRTNPVLIGGEFRTMRIQSMILALAVLTVFAASHVVSAADNTTAQRLFHIERNKNANIVVYDAMVLPDGSLREKDPVEVYWLKLAEDGARKKLKRIERRMAYGFKVRDHEGNRLRLDMKADIGRDIFVAAIDDTFRALIDIDGRRARLDRLYIFAKEGGLLPTVEYIELFGTDLETGGPRYEKFLP